MQIVRANSMSTIVKIAESDCAAGVSSLHIESEQGAASIDATHLRRRKGLGADSESRILAMKKFSCAEPSCLIAARQNRFFARIAENRFAAAFCPRDASSGVCERPERARARVTRRRANGAARRHAPFRYRVSTSRDRSPTAGWLCRRTTSSPGRRTSRPAAAWRAPVPPCRDWRR